MRFGTGRTIANRGSALPPHYVKFADESNEIITPKMSGCRAIVNLAFIGLTLPSTDTHNRAWPYVAAFTLDLDFGEIAAWNCLPGHFELADDC